MPLIKEKRLLENLDKLKYIKAIRVLSDTKSFQKKYNGSISMFFKYLKNSLQAINGVTNREFFKNLSGCYFSYWNEDLFEFIIIYDSSISELNELEIKIRIKKLIGVNSKIEFGNFEDFLERIKDIIGVTRKTQTFGDFYFNKSL